MGTRPRLSSAASALSAIAWLRPYVTEGSGAVLMLAQLGLWIVNSAKYWKTSTFVCISLTENAPAGFIIRLFQVGFDLVDVQIPLSILDPDIASRIEWVYGNM